MKLEEGLLRSLLNNITLNQRKDHFVSDCPLPSCGKPGHFYINRNSQLWDCKKCSEGGNIYQLLKRIGKTDLIVHGKTINVFGHIERKVNIDQEDNEKIDISLPKKTPPVGFRRIYDDPYLKSRGFVKEDFLKYKIGQTQIFKDLKDYIIILIEQDFEVKGYVARSKQSKAWIDEYNVKAKELKKPKHLRYRNSTNTDFAKMLFGLDECQPETKIAILVEGVFDKKNVDDLLCLNDQKEIKCFATFGKKVSKAQITRLQQKGIENIILIYDPDAINDSKKHSFELNKYFSVKVGFTSQCDCGDMDEEQLLDVLDKLEDPISFKISKLQKKIFKKESYE